MKDGAAWQCKERFISPDDEELNSYPEPLQNDGQPIHKSLALWEPTKWPGNGVRLRVAFIDQPTPPVELQNEVLTYMNTWGEFSNVRFTLIDDYYAAEVRVSFSGMVLGKKDKGNWSYVGTQVRTDITDRRRPTMMLTDWDKDTFKDKDTPEKKHSAHAVRHETGHTLGFVHEHLRPQLVERIDAEKTIKEYSNQWDRATTIANILTPLWNNKEAQSKFSLTEVADVHSIMCYPLHDDLLKEDMKEPPITGGRDFSGYDRKHAAAVYPIPKYEERVVSEDKETLGITAVGRQLYLRLSSGEIRAISAQPDGQCMCNSLQSFKTPSQPAKIVKTHSLGKVDDPSSTKLLGSGLLYRAEGYKVSRWDAEIEGWTVINEKVDSEYIQADARDGVVYFRDKAGMVTMYDNSLFQPWRQLYAGSDADAESWISSTKDHLFRQNAKGEIYKIPLPQSESEPPGYWDRIDQFTDTVKIVTNWYHVYQHRKNGEIWVYTGVGRFWFRVFKQQDSETFSIEASEDRLFRIETHDDGTSDVWFNDDNTEHGWKPLGIKKNSSFVYTGGFVYEFVKETGKVTRYTGICH
ncbi:hypothetical protein PM082_010647 [Marasmius tenuissimus]|nr:hypothetical protein PM082_010647 [Marasmius tenuissimus]